MGMWAAGAGVGDQKGERWMTEVLKCQTRDEEHDIYIWHFRLYPSCRRGSGNVTKQWMGGLA